MIECDEKHYPIFYGEDNDGVTTNNITYEDDQLKTQDLLRVKRKA